ncbi:MAG: amino acid ABC transporter permease [Lachnospiraceae bacterium]|nr:amino acid ABC transporter permease [Lachnospiraceae bacterium]
MTIQGIWEIFSTKMLIEGAVMTLKLTALSEALSIVFGFFLALMKTGKNKFLSKIIDVYIWLFRGLPLILVLIFVYNVFPQWGIKLTVFQSAVFSLVLNETAYMVEIMRSGLTSVDAGQKRAAKVLGLSNVQVLYYIVLPQAIRVLIPPIGNNLIGMLKTSSMASVISCGDLMRRANQIAASNFRYAETLIAAGIYYLFFSAVLAWVLRMVENHFDIQVARNKRRKKEEENEISNHSCKEYK